jgi:hypothetical protein
MLRLRSGAVIRRLGCDSGAPQIKLPVLSQVKDLTVALTADARLMMSFRMAQ